MWTAGRTNHVHAGTAIIRLLEFVLSATYFVYRGTFYKQIQGCAMGSPVSPIVANLYMEQFEREEWSKFLRAPEVWFRYVDDATPSLSYTNII